MSRTLVDLLEVVSARIESIGLTVYDGDPPEKPPANHWVQIAIDAGNLFSNGMDSRQEAVTTYFRPMCVGRSQSGTLDALGMIRGVLIGWDPWPDEATSGRVEEEETTPPLLPSTGVAGDFRFTITPTYKIRFDR